MKHQLLRAASVCALVVAMGGTAVAQGSSGGGSPGSSGPSGSSRQAPPASPGKMHQREPSSPGSSDTAPAQRTEPSETTRAKGDTAERPERPSDRQQKSGQRSPEGPAQKSTGRSDEGGDRTKRSQSSEQRSKDGEKDRSRSSKADREDRQRTSDGQDRRTGGGGDERDRARTQVSEQQRTTVRERLIKGGERNRVTNVKFDIRIGAGVPRNVTLHVLPPDVVEVVPAYRSYRYVYVGSEIVIVDPVTYEIVDVMRSGSRTAGSRQRLVIGASDRVFIREHIDRGFSIRLGIGGLSVGMDVPDSVELRPLPTVVVERVPDLRDHRYFVFEDEVAIVDPSTGEVVMILDN